MSKADDACITYRHRVGICFGFFDTLCLKQTTHVFPVDREPLSGPRGQNFDIETHSLGLLIERRQSPGAIPPCGVATFRAELSKLRHRVIPKARIFFGCFDSLCLQQRAFALPIDIELGPKHTFLRVVSCSLFKHAVCFFFKCFRVFGDSMFKADDACITYRH